MHQDSRLQEKIKHYGTIVTNGWNRYKQNRILAVSLAVLLVFSLFFILLMVIENNAYLSPLLKTSLLVTGLIISSIIGWAVHKKTPPITRFNYYRKVTRDEKLDQLRYLLDLSEDYRGDREQVLYHAALNQNISQLDESNTKSKLNKWNSNSFSSVFLKRGGLAFFFVLMITGAFSYQNPNTFNRSIQFFSVFEKPNPFVFTIEPGETTLEQGGRFFARISFEGDEPNRVVLSLKTDVEEQFRSLNMQRTTPGNWVSEPIELFSDLDYRILMDEFRSETKRIHVSQLPRFSRLIVESTPPAYTRLEPREFNYPFSRIEVPEGSDISINAIANKELDRADIFLLSLDSLITLNKAEATYGWNYNLNLTKPDTVRFVLSDFEGLENRNPYNFTFAVIPDRDPTVRILEPRPLLQELNPQNVTIRFEARDDYGFSSIHLRYEVHPAFSDNIQRGSTRLAGASPANFSTSYNWNVGSLRLQAMDEIVYWIEVFDNDEVNGYKSAVSGRQTIRFASLADNLLDQDERESDINRALDELNRQNQEARESMQQLREDIVNNPDDSWQQQRSTEDLIDQQEELNKQVDEIRQQFEELRKELEQDDILSEETLEMYQQLQQLMEEIDDPALMELLEQLRQGLEDMDNQQIRDALQQMEFNERSYQERLERTVELFKQLQLNAELDRMAALFEELAQMEEQLMELDDAQEQKARQENIQQELDKLQERLENIPNKSPNRQQQRMENMVQEMSPQMDSIQDQVQENIDGLQESIDSDQQPGTESQQQQRQIQEQLQQMSSSLAQARQQMNQEAINVNIFALKSLFQTMLLLSEAQETQNLITLGLEQSSPAFVNQARTQRNIANIFGTVVDSLMVIAKEVPQFPNMLLKERLETSGHLESSVEKLAERNKSQSTTAERIALGGINKITGMLSDLIDQLDEQGDGNGNGSGMSAEQMLEQMQEMGEQQQMLNQQIQDFINDMAGERLSQDQMDRLNQMARQQNEIRKQLEDLQRRGALRPGDSLMSELERLAEQMEDAINDLRGGSVDRLMVERQQDILSRMLEAERAFDERDQEERREGETPTDYERTRPPITLEELEREIRSRLQDPNTTRFSEDYQRLIRMYFELLQEREGREIQLPSE